MKANKSQMVPVPLAELNPEAGLPFPLFLLLARTDRMVPLRQAGDPLGPQLYRELLEKRHVNLWAPQSYAAELSGHVGPQGSQPTPLQERLSPAGAALLLKEFRSLDSVSAKKEWPTLAQARDVINELLLSLAEKNPLYGQVASMRASLEPGAHSVSVGTLCGLMALSVGFDDREVVANLVVAACFHDIGLARTGLPVGPRSRWGEADFVVYHKHVSAGLEMLARCDPPLPPEVLMLVRELHESEPSIVGSAFLALSDRLDLLFMGEDDGRPMSPSKAFQLLASPSKAFQLLASPAGQAGLSPEVLRNLLELVA